jgi:hypothetical protein
MFPKVLVCFAMFMTVVMIITPGQSFLYPKLLGIKNKLMFDERNKSDINCMPLLDPFVSFSHDINHMKLLQSSHQYVEHQYIGKQTKLSQSSSSASFYSNLQHDDNSLREIILKQTKPAFLPTESETNDFKTSLLPDIDTPDLLLQESVTTEDSFIHSLNFAKNFIETTSLLIRSDMVSIISILFPMLTNSVQMVASILMHNDIFQETILPALALYCGNILFIIFL